MRWLSSSVLKLVGSQTKDLLAWVLSLVLVGPFHYSTSGNIQSFRMVLYPCPDLRQSLIMEICRTPWISWFGFMASCMTFMWLSKSRPINRPCYSSKDSKRDAPRSPAVTLSALVMGLNTCLNERLQFLTDLHKKPFFALSLWVIVHTQMAKTLI